jgi:hypothetical protein
LDGRKDFRGLKRSIIYEKKCATLAHFFKSQNNCWLNA